MKIKLANLMKVVEVAESRQDVEFIWHGKHCKFPANKEPREFIEIEGDLMDVRYLDVKPVYGSEEWKHLIGFQLNPDEFDEYDNVALTLIYILAYTGMIEIPEITFTPEVRGTSTKLLCTPTLTPATKTSKPFFEVKFYGKDADFESLYFNSAANNAINSKSIKIRNFAEGLLEKYRETAKNIFDEEVEVDAVKCNDLLPRELYELDDYDFKEYIESGDYLEIMNTSDSYQNVLEGAFDSYKSIMDDLDSDSQKYNTGGWELSQLTKPAMNHVMYDIFVNNYFTEEKDSDSDVLRDFEYAMSDIEYNEKGYKAMSIVLGLDFPSLVEKALKRFLKNYKTYRKDASTIMYDFGESKYYSVLMDDIADAVEDHFPALRKNGGFEDDDDWEDDED